MSTAASMRAAIQRDVESVIFRFFLHLDEQEYDQLAQLMAPTGTWLRNGALLKGLEGVREAPAGKDGHAHACQRVQAALCANVGRMA